MFGLWILHLEFKTNRMRGYLLAGVTVFSFKIRAIDGMLLAIAEVSHALCSTTATFMNC